MVRLYSAAQMREADRLAADAGVPSLELMENAGRATAGVATRLLDQGGLPGTTHRHPASGPVLVLAGKGNNGGDGLVAARLLAGLGLSVEVILAAGREDFAGDAGENLARLLAQGRVNPRTWGHDADPALLADLVSRAPVVIDALLGTGAGGAPRGAVGEIIAGVAAGPAGEARPLVLAVDVPSGLDADTGRVADPATVVRAHATVTFGGVKLGLAAAEAAPFTGRVYLAPIGIPGDCLERAAADAAVGVGWLLPADAAGLLPERPVAGHKGAFGHLWVLGGSPGFTGAAVLAALGALRAGVGLVTALCPSGSRELVAGAVPEALTRELPAGPDGRIGPGSIDTLAEALKAGRAWGPEASPSPGPALVAGPGMGATAHTRLVVTVLLQESAAPLLLDADALNALALGGPNEVARALEPAAGRTVVTPHPGEMARLTGRSVSEIQADRIAAAAEAARRWKVVVVLKGAGTVVASPEGKAWINATGNPGMATAGSGDVLAGLVGALLAQGLGPLPAALVGVSTHGLAGDLAAREIGRRGLLARDLAHGLPAAMDALGTAPGYGPVLLPVPGPSE